MACRGVHFALTEDDANKLLKAAEAGQAVDFIQEVVEARWEEEWLQETDKPWDAIHRCSTDGTLNCKRKSPLEKCVLGGRQLQQGNDYIISFLTAEEVREVAAAVAGMSMEVFHKRYWGLKRKLLWFDLSDYAGPISEDDFEYSWSYFAELVGFFQKAASGKRSLVFSVDQ